MTDTVSRRRWLYGGVAMVAVGAGLGGAWWREHQTHSAAGERMDDAFWSRTFTRPDGGEVRMADLKGKPMLLNFWATWCPPCIEELPMIDRFYKDHASNGWQVVGLAIDQPTAVRKFLEKLPVTFPVGLAGLEGTDLVKQLGNTAGGLPFTLVLSADGAIAARKMGKVEPADLEAWRRAEVHG
ncbi:TlpA family protein disulfide reductase [Variovorax sp. PAMC 28711]|uniref:TlpA family protein disulfide reductase n=1 Tax=Variovorax sp. PAMC 28711 TaxID=1795631 RepID=UPI00078D63E1|nr:TlpA disulfide reductase family protein [Variovorax sp. PAMC 28711]AMM24083.1 redoxin [Variovorax sp. PAMC 28711]